MNYDYAYQVKLIGNQELCADFDKPITKPNDPKFMFLMFRFQILEPELANPSEDLARSLMEKLFEFEGHHQTQDQELINNNKYPFFKTNPVSETLKHKMLEEITEVANEALVKARNDPSIKRQISLIFTVNGGDGVRGEPSCGGDDDDDGDDVVKGLPCVICRDRFENIKGVIKLNCECVHHLYHDACAWKWLKANHTCPTCRFNFALGRDQFTVPAWKWLMELRKSKRESPSEGLPQSTEMKSTKPCLTRGDSSTIS